MVITTLVLLLSTSGAQASTRPVHSLPACATITRCQSAELFTMTPSSKGLVVEFSTREGALRATLEEISYLRNPKTRVIESLAELPCRTVVARPNPDDSRVIVACADPQLADAGYTVELHGADIAGVQRARVYEDNIAGRRELATLVCR